MESSSALETREKSHTHTERVQSGKENMGEEEEEEEEEEGDDLGFRAHILRRRSIQKNWRVGTEFIAGLAGPIEKGFGGGRFP